MCGILGQWSEAVPDIGRFRYALEAMRHRGPDCDGIEALMGGRLVLGHRRLSVIDLSDAARQPLSDQSGKFHVVFNGEIYNFAELRSELADLGWKFKTSSDTEVLLASYATWGACCLERIDGMFAFAVFDAHAKTIFFARDRAGEKPLYIARANRTLAFSSEIRALMLLSGVDSTLSWRALQGYLQNGYYGADETPFASVTKLSPATSATYDLETGRFSTRQYWSIPAPEESRTACDERELVIALRQELWKAVKRQLVSDVPLGVLLSGGIDSSLVAAAAAAQSSNRIRTFTICFPGEGRYNEQADARLVASHLGTEHTELTVDASTLSGVTELGNALDVPLGDSSMIPMLLVSKLTRQYVTVALGGDGGDELFGGYLARWIRLQRQWGWIPTPVRRAAGYLARGIPEGRRGRAYLQTIGKLDRAGLTPSAHFSNVLRRRLLSRKLSSIHPVDTDDARAAMWNQSLSYADNLCRIDFSTYLPGDILQKVDNASMAHSLEVRAPWLSRNVIEFAFREVPAAHKVDRLRVKKLPKLLAKQVLPTSFQLERKQGFSIPLQRWLTVDNRTSTVFRDIMHSLPKDVFEHDECSRLWSELQRGYSHQDRIYSLVTFELWRTRNRIDYQFDFQR